MSDSRDTSPNHAHRCAPTHVEAGARVAALADRWSKELYSEDEISGASRYNPDEQLREAGYRRGHNDRTLACLRELRSALVVETVPLFEASTCPGSGRRERA